MRIGKCEPAGTGDGTTNEGDIIGALALTIVGACSFMLAPPGGLDAVRPTGRGGSMLTLTGEAAGGAAGKTKLAFLGFGIVLDSKSRGQGNDGISTSGDDFLKAALAAVGKNLAKGSARAFSELSVRTTTCIGVSASSQDNRTGTPSTSYSP